MGAKVLVKFLRHNLPYNAGECAAFPPAVARRFVRAGVAAYAAPARASSPAPAVPVHLGGGWYQVGDQKIKGKKAAYAAVTKPAQGVTK